MQPEKHLRHVLPVLIPLAVATTIYLFLYPVFLGCAFPLPSSDPSDSSEAFQQTLQHHLRRLPVPVANTDHHDLPQAPFRLLALGDPQLEGDTSIPDYETGPFPHLRTAIRHFAFQTEFEGIIWQRLRGITHEIVDIFFEDIPNFFEGIRKRIDLFGNDFYLAHIYHTMMWWSRPTHVAVLGDLVGSQWISDEEFDYRSHRYWNRTFAGGQRVPDDAATYPSSEYDVSGYLGLEYDNPDAVTWQKRLINIAGNHDIGYAGDLSIERLERFERQFGKAAYELRFELPITDPVANASIYDAETNPTSRRLTPELRVIVLNNMNLDTPAWEQSLQDQSYAFINDVIGTSSSVDYKGHFTTVLTHVPLYKPEGVCVDAPYFDFHEYGGLMTQNQLSADASRGFLEGIYGLNGDANAPGQGMGRPGVVLNGHDHEGCDTYHYINQTVNEGWQVHRWEKASSDKIHVESNIPGVREITVRSMMADYGGNAGLLSLWFNQDTWEWEFEFANCAFGRQHFWWFVYVLDITTIVLIILQVLVLLGVPLPDIPVEALWSYVVSSASSYLQKKKKSPTTTTTTAARITPPPPTPKPVQSVNGEKTANTQKAIP